VGIFASAPYPSSMSTEASDGASDEAGSTTRERLFAVGKGALVVFLAFLGAVVVATVGQVVAVVLGFAPETLRYRYVVTASQFLGFGLGVAAYLAAADDWALLDGRVRVPSRTDAAYLVGGLVVLLVASTAIGRLLAELGVETAQNQVIATGRENPVFFLWMVPVSVFLVGPFEELVFRGGLQGHLRRAWGPAPAVALASAGFGAVHLTAVIGGREGALVYVVVAAVLGLVLGVAYERTDNLVVPAAAHGFYNATLFVVQYADVTGLV
jgi:hypothetical protein